MNYLIDGHNLIGKIEDINLSDPDDEAKLVLRLINWAVVGKNRRVIVVFDGGVEGVQWANFKSERVKTVFVPRGKTADEWLIRFMKNNVKNVKEFHLVTSDRAILKQAENRRIPATLSEQFADAMAVERANLSQIAQEPKQEQERPLLKAHEVDAWVQFFGGEQQIELKPYQPRKRKPKPKPEPVSAETSSQPREKGLLSPDEVAEWLNLFGGEPTIISYREPNARAKASPHSQPNQRKTLKPTRKGPKVDPDKPISQEDVDLWHTLFGD